VLFSRLTDPARSIVLRYFFLASFRLLSALDALSAKFESEMGNERATGRKGRMN